MLHGVLGGRLQRPLKQPALWKRDHVRTPTALDCTASVLCQSYPSPSPPAQSVPALSSLRAERTPRLHRRPAGCCAASGACANTACGTTRRVWPTRPSCLARSARVRSSTAEALPPASVNASLSRCAPPRPGPTDRPPCAARLCGGWRPSFAAAAVLPRLWRVPWAGGGGVLLVRIPVPLGPLQHAVQVPAHRCRWSVSAR